MRPHILAIALLALGLAPAAAQGPYQADGRRLDPGATAGPVSKAKNLTQCDATPYIKCNAIHEQMNCHAEYDIHAQKCRPHCQKTGKSC